MIMREVAILRQEVVDVGDFRIFTPSYTPEENRKILDMYFTDGDSYRYVFPEQLTRREFINALREIATEIEKVETPYIYK